MCNDVPRRLVSQRSRLPFDSHQVRDGKLSFDLAIQPPGYLPICVMGNGRIDLKRAECLRPIPGRVPGHNQPVELGGGKTRLDLQVSHPRLGEEALPVAPAWAC